MPLQFDYFYGCEAEQFTFYRIPKLLITSPVFKKLSNSAKLLYGLMLDRMSLSLKNGWVDDENRAYIYFTTNDVMEQMCCGTEKATKLLAELDVDKGIGLIERRKQGQGRPAIVYLKNFVKKKRFEEKGNHTFRQKNCVMCGKPFWPSNGQEVLCSKECKAKNRREKQLAYYHENKDKWQKRSIAI